MTIKDQMPVRGLWSSRVALFSLLLILTSLFLHRIFYFPTPTLFVCLSVAYILSIFALILGIVSGVRIWRNGDRGAARVFLGSGVGFIIGIIPFFLILMARYYPVLNDVTTNTLDPPLFKVLAQERKGGANPVLYPSSSFAPLQNKAYPDLVSLRINRSLQDTFDLVLETLTRLQMRLISVEPPNETNAEGRIEAVHRTLLIGFYNDLVVRIRGNATMATIDLRSTSRYGKSDFGYNARLLRSIMRELSSKLGVSLPSGTGEGNQPPQSMPPATQQKTGSPKKGAGDR